MANKKRQTASDSKKQSGQPTKSGKRLTEKRTMLSIRLTERERELLTEAADVQEQSPTGFIKSSAIAKAAHVVNISKKTTVDFGGIAHRVATLLFTQEFEREYRTKYMTGSNYPVRSDEVLTRGDLDDEINEWVGSVPFADVPETWMLFDDDPETHEVEKVSPTGVKHIELEYLNPEAPIVRDDRDPMTKNDFRELENAVRLGGTEFLQHILEIGRRMGCFQEEDLKAPIDPEIID